MIRYKQMDYPNLHKHIPCEDGMWVLYDDHAAELATLRAEVERLREALSVFAADSSWRRDGCCDANSACFMGQFIAKEALK